MILSQLFRTRQNKHRTAGKVQIQSTIRATFSGSGFVNIFLGIIQSAMTPIAAIVAVEDPIILTGREIKKIIDRCLRNPQRKKFKGPYDVNTGEHVVIDLQNTFPAFKDELISYADNVLAHKFDILGVSLDRSRDEWLKAIEDDGLVWTQISDIKYWQCEAAQLYAVNSIPATLLLDKEGKIIAKNLGEDELKAKLIELLGE